MILIAIFDTAITWARSYISVVQKIIIWKLHVGDEDSEVADKPSVGFSLLPLASMGVYFFTSQGYSEIVVGDTDLHLAA